MIALPIVRRELRIASRRPATYFNRLRGAVFGLLFGAWVLLLSTHTAMSFGPVLFHTLAVVILLYAITAGLGTTTDCLSQEKRENTIGFLFLTDLKGYDVVLGKLAATSMHAIYGLVAVFPILAIPLLAGGVSGAELGRVTLAVLANLFFSLSVGMFCSAMCRDERVAAGLALVIICVFTFVLPVMALVLWEEYRISPHPLFFVPSPGYASFMAFDVNWGRAQNFFHPALACVTGMSLVFLALAAYLLPRTWQDAPDHPWRLRVVEKGRQLLLGSPTARQALRSRLLEVNPFLWLTSRHRGMEVVVWLSLLGILLLWGGFVWQSDIRWTEEGLLVLAGLAARTLLKLAIGTEACRRMVLDRNSGALELLLSTPLSPKEIVRGQLLALLRQFLGPSILVICIDITFLAAHARQDAWVLTWCGWIIVFVADMITLSWLGIWMGLRGRSVNRAAGATIGRVLVLPWAAFFILVTLLFAGGARGGPGLKGEDFLIVMVVLALVFDWIFLHSARTGLLNDFREIAASPRQPLGMWRIKPPSP